MQVDNCIICTEPFCENQISLFCGHKFHLHCINQWTQTSDTCPMCRGGGVVWSIDTPKFDSRTYTPLSSIEYAHTKPRMFVHPETKNKVCISASINDGVESTLRAKGFVRYIKR